MELRRMLLAEVARLCREETAKFLHRLPSRDEFCYELLRRAIGERDQAAWDAVFAQYRGVVLAWVRQHPAGSAVREDDEYWVNRSFERFWSAVGPERFALFPNLATVLRYLKLCAHSVLLDAVRALGPQPPVPLTEQAVATGAAGGVVDAEAVAAGEVAVQELRRAIDAELHDEAERLVAHLCLVLDLKPREVYERHPDRFADVADVYRVKRNLLERLRRSPAIRRFLD
jgi:hypothetical protein